MINFPASSYNEVMHAIRRSKPLPGLRARVTETSAGVVIASALPPPGWNHPWEIHPYWKEETQKDGTVKGNWHITITSGFVNGADVVIGKTDSPLTDDPLPSLEITGFRDATGLNGHYPALFKKLGARKPEEPDPELAAALGGTVEVEVPMFPEQYGTRRLMAADIVLHVDHGGTRSDAYLAVPTSGNLVLSSLAFTPPVDRYPYRIEAVSLFRPVEYPTMADRLLGDYDEPNFDELQLATLWLLSPPDEPDDTPPGPNWQPFPQHFVFWNLGYAGVNQFNFTQSEPITIHTGLAFGLLDQIGNGLLAPINDAYQNALNALNETSTRGHFWTL